MASAKKAPFHKRLYMMALFWLLICFEPLSKYQFILTCLPEAPVSNAMMSLEGRSLRTAKITVLVLSREGNIEDFGEGLVCFGEETSETLTQTESAAQMRYRMYLKRKEDSRRITANLYRLYNSSLQQSYEDDVLFKNLSLWKRPMVVEMPAAYLEKDFLLGSPTCCERPTEGTKDEKKKQTQQQGKGKKPQQQQKHQQQQQQQQQEQRQEYQQEQQQKQQREQQQQQQQQKRKLPGCACQCRPSDTVRSGKPKRCILQLKNLLLVMWGPSKLNITSSTSRPKPDLTQHAINQSQGRRIRKVQSRPWNVDATPNHKGQAQRNAVKFQNESIDLHDLHGSGGGHRGVVDLLLMSTLQRHAPTESGFGVEMLRFFLVCLACLCIIQSRMEDQKGRRVTKKGRTRRLLSLDFLLRLGKRLWTARTDTESNKLLRDTTISNPVTHTANRISSGVEKHSGDTTAVDGVTTHVDGVMHSFFGAERCCSAAGASDREAAGVPSPEKSSYSRPTEMDDHNSADMQPPFMNDLMIRDVLQFLTEGGVFQTEDLDIIEADLKADEDVDPQTRSVWNALFNCDHQNKHADDDAHPHTRSVLKDALFNVGHETKHAELIEEILHPASCHNKAAYQQNNANPGVCHNNAANHPNSAYQDYDEVASYQSNNVYQVYPATGFLPTLGGGDGTRGYLDHVGYRLASLAALPTWCKMSRVRLSEAGFHYDPRANPGAVVCHRCGAAYSLGSSGEEGSATTTPLVFHQQASPDCPFMARILEPLTHMPPITGPASQVSTSAGSAPAQMSEMTSSSAGTTTGAMGLVSADSAPSVAAPEHSNNARDLSEDCDAMRPTPTGYTLALPGSSADQRPPPSNRDGAGRDSEVDRPSLDLSSAVYPQFSTATSRLTTFRTWPQELMETFPPQALVALGFYFAGYADCIRCFFCGVGLKAWDPADDALTEHVRWRPQCGFLLATKGRQHIQNIVDRINARAGNRNSQSAPSTTSQTAPQSNTGSSGAATSAGNSRQISAASDGSGQASQNNPGSTTGRQGMQSDGSGSVRTQEDHLTQQLRTMGFSSDDIARTRQRLQSSGQPCDLDNFLASLLEGL